MRHRKKTKHRRTRRHRVGAINVKNVAMKVAGVAAGAFVGRTIQNMAVKTFPSINAKYIGIGTVVLGAVIPKLLKSDLGNAVGDGVLAVGAISTLTQFGVITGIGSTGRRVAPRVLRMNGYNPNSSAVGAYNKNSSAVGQRPYNREVVMGMKDESDQLMMGALLYDE
jgi:hypothetical protein